jgi:hypothetical protein
MAGANGGGLTVEFYKSATALARDTLGCKMGGPSERYRMKRKERLTAWIRAVARKVCYDTLVASLFGGGGARCRGGTFAPVVWGTGGPL